MSPDSGTENKVDQVAFSKRERSSLRDVRAMRGADVGSHHHSKRQDKECQSEEGEGWRSAF